jgi:hypothetical protein
MQENAYPPYESRSLTEHLVFIALLIPTFVVLVAAVVSITSPDPSIVVQHPIVTTAACDPCPRHEDEYAP